MSELHQSGHHPDADQLNAFVERALPPHEHEQTLAHLAVCSACRSIVSLSASFSLPAAEPVHTHIKPVRRPWFSGWNLVWPVAAAFAALIPLTLYLHKTATAPGNSTPLTEVAVTQPPAALPPPASTPPPAEKTPPAKAAPPHTDDEKAPGPPAVPSAAMAYKRSGMIAAAPAEPSDAAASPVAAASPAIPSPSAQARPLRPSPPAADNSGIYGGTGATNLNQNYVAAVPLPPTASSASDAASDDAANQSVTVTDAPPMLGMGMANASSTGMRRERAALQAPLPSGLPILSTVSNGRLTVALDTGNTLFFSDDQGRRWRPVSAPWKGRAINVKLAAVPATPTSSAAQGSGVRFAASNAAGLSGTAINTLAGALAPNSGVAGIVTDATGAFIPNASVTLTEISPTDAVPADTPPTEARKQRVRSATTDPAGLYLIDGVPPGNYRIEASAPGFERRGLAVTLASGQSNVVNLTLQVGSAAETITVQAQSSAIALSRPAAKAMAAASQPAPLFEITTESGDRWTSPDGQTWTRRP